VKLLLEIVSEPANFLRMRLTVKSVQFVSWKLRKLAEIANPISKDSLTDESVSGVCVMLKQENYIKK
jgi:hypothetical protein